MKNINFYQEQQIKNSKEVFEYFLDTLLDSNRTWKFFVDWKKIFDNVKKYDYELDILNKLIESKNFDKELTDQLINHHKIVKTFPLLIAIRNNYLKILDETLIPEFSFKECEFSTKSFEKIKINSFIEFFDKSGLKNFILTSGIKNFKDYLLGVEVGLDTNARKNRGGKIMEEIVETLFKTVYSFEENRDYISQGSPEKVKKIWNLSMPIDKSTRKPDFILYKKNKLFWIETNFYSGGGTKLKATCGEYKALHDFCKKNNLNFIWITDGIGWKETRLPLEETFIHNDYIFNLQMLRKGILNFI